MTHMNNDQFRFNPHQSNGNNSNNKKGGTRFYRQNHNRGPNQEETVGNGALRSSNSHTNLQSTPSSAGGNARRNFFQSAGSYSHSSSSSSSSSFSSSSTTYNQNNRKNASFTANTTNKNPKFQSFSPSPSTTKRNGPNSQQFNGRMNHLGGQKAASFSNYSRKFTNCGDDEDEDYVYATNGTRQNYFNQNGQRKQGGGHQAGGKEMTNRSLKLNMGSAEGNNSAQNQAPAFNHHNYKNYQPPPFNPPPYHNNQAKQKEKANQCQIQTVQSAASMATGGQNSPPSTRTSQEQTADKYSRKYNLISFILLRKNDEYLVNEKFYFNDQYNYERVDHLVEQLDFMPLMTLYSTPIDPTTRFADYVNSYNCSIFVYTIRKLVEKWASLKSAGCKKSGNLKKRVAVAECIRFMFSEGIRPSTYFLIDGDYPRRNLMHYAARYGCKLVGELIRESLTSEGAGLEYNGGEFVMAHLCMQPDFNGNTVIHLAAQSSSLQVLRQINPVCIRSSLYIYNDEGLNTFLIACRYASLKFIRCFVESLDTGVVAKLIRESRDQANIKNCLHFACGRGCGKSCLQVVSYLTELATSVHSDMIESPNVRQSLLNQLLVSSSPLVGSAYHVAASNLTRLSTLYHLLTLIDVPPNDENNNSTADIEHTEILNKLDFRGFGVVDCLFDSLMNLREMAPAAYRSLSQYYDELLSTTCFRSVVDEVRFDELLRRCVFKLVNDFRAVVFCMPRITTKLQVLEFLKILAFMCKFPHRVNCKTSEETNFEMFCVNFVRKFILDGELLNLRSRQGQGSNLSDQQLDTNDSDTLIDLLDAFYQLVAVILRSSTARNHHIFTQQHVRIKLVSMLKTYFTRLVDHFGQTNITSTGPATTAAASPGPPNTLFTLTDTDDDGVFSSSSCCSSTRAAVIVSSPQLIAANHYHSIDDYIYYRSKLIDYKIKLERLEASLDQHTPRTLKDMARDRVNSIITHRLGPAQLGPIHRSASWSSSLFNLRSPQSMSALSPDFVYFKLPPAYHKFINFLTNDLVQDLYGQTFDLEKLLRVSY